MTRMKSFNADHPAGDTPGMERVQMSVLQAAVANAAPLPAAMSNKTTGNDTLVAKSLRLPSDLVEFIDFVFTKERRMKKQDAYAMALEAYFRPLMERGRSSD